MVDSTDKERISIDKDELHRHLAEKEFSDVVVLILANKQDLPTAMSVDEIQDKLDLSYYTEHTPELLKSLKTNTLLRLLPDDIIDILSSYTPQKECKVMQKKYLKWNDIFSYGSLGRSVFCQRGGSMFVMEEIGTIIAEYYGSSEVGIGNQICEIFGCCAKTGDGLWEGFDWMSLQLQLNNSKLNKDCNIL